MLFSQLFVTELNKSIGLVVCEKTSDLLKIERVNKQKYGKPGPTPHLENACVPIDGLQRYVAGWYILQFPF